MADYRDYGSIGNNIAALVEIDKIKRTQVYTATHDGAGNRLPFMNRSFISFSYGGKIIEDFNLIVTVDGDRMSRNLYANFSDNITTSTIFDGQLWWSTHFDNNELSLNLSTDGMTQLQLDAFKHWFKPGIERELILAENPNRAIMARVGQVPSYNVLPFEEKVSRMLGGVLFETSTTVYKGDINITFIMDDPHWYSIKNILYYEDDEGNIDYDTWEDSNGNQVSVYDNKDAIKIMIEDGVPNVSMISADVLLGIDKVAASDMMRRSLIFADETADIGIGSGENEEQEKADEHVALVGLMLNSANGLSISAGEENAKYFYYPGTAPVYPTIQFTAPITLNNDGYISSIKNEFVNEEGDQYNTIFAESTNIMTFQFTTPSLYTAYNQVIHIFSTLESGISWEDLRKLVRETVKHYIVRQYAINVIDNTVQGVVTNENQKSSLINGMKAFIPENAIASFSFNGTTGEAIGTLMYNDLSGQSQTIEEDVGDMVISKYLKLEDRNYLSEEGKIEPWTEENPTTSYRIYHDIEGGLTKVMILYHYMYL